MNIEVNEKLINFLWFLPLFFISLAIHEYSHAFLASRMGDNTAKNQGRLSLNPIKHLDLIGSILMPLISFTSGAFIIGWAKPVPVDRRNFRNVLRDDAIVSAAGPFSNLILAFLFLLVYSAVSAFFGDPAVFSERLARVLFMGAYFNVFLFAFNLLPIPPLDGSHILYDLFPNNFTARLAGAGLYGFLILIVFIYSPLWAYFSGFIEFIFGILVKISGIA